MLQHNLRVLPKTCFTKVTVGYAPTEIASPTKKDVFCDNDSWLGFKKDCQPYPKEPVLQVTVGYAPKELTSPTRRMCSTTVTVE